jgi:4-amino-4-deoxy-L-arabinose transferase-like glycosyltransferase
MLVPMSVTDHVPASDRVLPGDETVTARSGDLPGIGRSHRASLATALAIFVFTLACHLPLLGSAPIGGTEGHRALPAHDMVRTGQWLVPKLFGQIYLAKPPLHHWLIALSEITFRSDSVFVWRLPSALAAAILNVALYCFGVHWFGRIGGIVSGMSGLALVVLWGQARTADIDSTNTLATGIASLCLLELHFARPSRRWPWIWLAGLACGATLLIKGPAGLPLIAGVLLWSIIDAAWRKDTRVVRVVASASTWMPLLISLVMFGLYALAVLWWLRSNHLRPDYSGLHESAAKSHPQNIGQLLQALSLPLLLFAYALPISLALPLMMVRDFRVAVRESGRRGGMDALHIANALMASTLLAWLVCVLIGMTNTRYGYVALTLLCPLAGAIAGAVQYLRPSAVRVLRAMIVAMAVLLAGGVCGLTFMAWKGGAGQWLMIGAASCAVVVAVTTFQMMRSNSSWNGAWGLVVIIALAAVPFAYHFRLDRFDRSGYGQAAFLTRTVGPGATVLTGQVLRSQPELFYYADVNTLFGNIAFLPGPDHFEGGYWVCLSEAEYNLWVKVVPDRLSRLTRFRSHKLSAVIAWYARASTGPTTSPALPQESSSQSAPP